MDVRDELERVLDEILRPLLEADGGGVDVISVTDDEVVLALTGAFRGDPGAPYVQAKILRPAILKALGREVRVRWVVARDERISRSA